MSKKRQTRNSKKFKKAAASKRARAPMQKGGRMFAGGTSGFDPRTGTIKQAPRRPAGQTDGINPNPMKDFPPRTTAGPKRPPDIGTPRPEPRPTGCLLYTSPSPRDRQKSRMPSSA